MTRPIGGVPFGGKPLRLSPTTAARMSIQDRIDFNSHPEPNTGCTLWSGSLSPKGYAKISIGCRRVIVTRVILGLLDRPDLFACHHCDNPICVNPAHLFVGTASDNVRDQLRKGRHINAAKTHCKQGHPFTEANTMPRGNNRNGRICRTCHGIWHPPASARSQS